MQSILAFFSRHLAVSLMVGIAVVIFALLAFDSAGMPKNEKAEFNPYVLCTAGRTVIKRPEGSVTLLADKNESVRQGDQIKTLRQSSATVFWSDGSVTRLSENTTIDVNELVNDRKTASTKVDFSLEEGKTWSHVYRYLSDDSHFRERFDDGRKLAAVRGTAFEVNADKGYLRTASHAVEVTDPAGKLLSTVPEGIAVSVRDLTALLDSALDSAWKDLNLVEDAKYSAEFAKRAREEVTSRMASLKGLPVSLSFSGDTLSVRVSPDMAKTAQDGQSAYAGLLKVYETTAALPETAENIRSKEALRDAILAAAPESEKAKLATLFARHQTYDSWAAKSISDEEFLSTRKKLHDYVSAGADAQVLENLELALPKARIDQFNATMDALKKRGFDTLSDPGWLVPSVDEAIKEANSTADEAIEEANSAVEDAKNLIPSFVK
ncbi:MAG: FecR protein [Patescibacteria group bacterium]|nr:FecR protein [Patescibacteria group bacterium]